MVVGIGVVGIVWQHGSCNAEMFVSSFRRSVCCVQCDALCSWSLDLHRPVAEKNLSGPLGIKDVWVMRLNS